MSNYLKFLCKYSVIGSEGEMRCTMSKTNTAKTIASNRTARILHVCVGYVLYIHANHATVTLVLK